MNTTGNDRQFLGLALCAACQVAGLAYYIHFFSTWHYLPTPFIYDKFNTFMDFYNVLYWANKASRYTEWGSVYPPINFIFLKIISHLFLGKISGIDSYSLRNLGYGIPMLLCALYLLIPAVVVRTEPWSRFRLREKIAIYILAITSAPMLFALERGNLILFAPLFLAFVLADRVPVRLAALAVLINLKPYFALLMFSYIAKRQWRELRHAMACAGILFLVSGIILDRHFLLFFINLFSLTQNSSLFPLREVMAFPSSVSAFSYAIRVEGLALPQWLGGRGAFLLIAALIECLKWLVIGFAVTMMWRRAMFATRREMITMLVVLIVNAGMWVGGYSMIFFFPLLPILLEMRFRKFYVVSILLMFLPIDIIPFLHYDIGEYRSFLGGVTVKVDWMLSVSSFIRPILNLTILAVMTLELSRRKTASNNRAELVSTLANGST